MSAIYPATDLLLLLFVGRMKKLQSELKSVRLDLKLVELNGKTWDQQLEVPGLEDAIGRGDNQDRNGELEYFSSRNEQVVTQSTCVLVSVLLFALLLSARALL